MSKVSVLCWRMFLLFITTVTDLILWSTDACFLTPLSLHAFSLIYPVFFLLYPAFSLINSAFFSLYLAFSLIYSAFLLLYPAFFLLYPALSLFNPDFFHIYPVFWLLYPTYFLLFPVGFFYILYRSFSLSLFLEGKTCIIIELQYVHG